MTRTSRTTTSELTVIGIDIGKDVFHIVGFDPDGKIVLRRKIKRLALVTIFEKLPRCIVGLEACLSAHFGSLRRRLFVVTEYQLKREDKQYRTACNQ